MKRILSKLLRITADHNRNEKQQRPFYFPKNVRRSSVVLRVAIKDMRRSIREERSFPVCSLFFDVLWTCL
jgi:hypothetical protein